MIQQPEVSDVLASDQAEVWRHWVKRREGKPFAFRSLGPDTGAPALVVTCAASCARVAAKRGRPAGAEPSAVTRALRRAPVGLFRGQDPPR